MMALLAGITALAPFSLQIFLPALPAIQASFAVTPGIVQLALSLSILPMPSPISPMARCPTTSAGVRSCWSGSPRSSQAVSPALAPSIQLLIIARIVQSVGGAAGMVLARAIVRDLYDRERSASIIAYLTMAMVVAPMLAPTIGAVLLDVASWRAIFFVATGVGVVLIWPIVVTLAETRPPEARRLGDPLAGAGALLRSGAFLSYALQSTFGICIFFSFIAGAPYFMMDVLGRSATEYGLWFILVSAAFMVGNLVAGRFSARIGLDRMVLTGSLLGVAGAGLAFALLLAGFWMPLALFGPIMAVGRRRFAVPNAQAGAVSVQPLLAGTASGIAGFSQMFVAALVSQAVGMLQNGTPYPMAGFMVGCAVLSFLGFVLRRRWAAKSLVGQEVRIEGLERVVRGSWKSPLGQPVSDARARPRIRIGLDEYVSSIASRLGLMRGRPAAAADARHRVEPAPAALRLELMLQEMQEHDHKVALDGFLLADAQVLDLLDQVHDIEALEIPLAQEPGLLLDPQAEVALVERSTFLGHWIRVPPWGLHVRRGATLA